MSHITRGLYKTAPEAFNDAANVRKALSKFQNTAKRFILPELADAFSNGKYLDWTNLTNSIRRAFNVKEEKQTPVLKIIDGNNAPATIKENRTLRSEMVTGGT